MTARILVAILAFLFFGCPAIRIFVSPQIRLRSRDLGTTEEPRGIVTLEDQLAAEIEKSRVGEYDGDESGPSLGTTPLRSLAHPSGRCASAAVALQPPSPPFPLSRAHPVQSTVQRTRRRPRRKPFRKAPLAFAS